MKLTNMQIKMSSISKCLIALWCMLEILCFGGLQFGWASLAYILKREKFFQEECNTERECDSQDAKLSFLYSISSGFLIVPLLFCGYCMSNFGLAKTRVLFTCVFVLGCVFAIVASPENPWLMSVGLALLGGGGRVFFLTSLQRSSQFKKACFVVSAAMSGCYDSSAAVMLIVKIAFDAGIGRRLSFAFILGLSTTTFLNTYLNFTTSKPEEQMTVEKCPRKHSIKKLKEVIVESICNKFTCTTELTSHVVWFCMIVAHVMFIFSSSHIYIREAVKNIGNIDASSLTDIQSAALTAGFAPALFAGIYLELFKLMLKGTESTRNIKTLIIGIISINILSIITAVLSVFYLLPVVYTTFFVFPVLRGFFYSVAYTYLVQMLPKRSIGITSSLLDVLACVLMFAQKPIILWLQSYDNAFLHIRITFATLSVFAMFHPVILWIKLSRLNRAESNEMSEESEDEITEPRNVNVVCHSVNSQDRPNAIRCPYTVAVISDNSILSTAIALNETPLTNGTLK